MANACGATDHGNRHSIVNTYYDVLFIVDLLVSAQMFDKHPGRGSGDNPEHVSTDLYGRGMTTMASGVPLQNYIHRARGNWYKSTPTPDDEAGAPLPFEDNVDDLAPEYISRDEGE